MASKYQSFAERGIYKTKLLNAGIANQNHVPCRSHIIRS